MLVDEESSWLQDTALIGIIIGRSVELVLLVHSYSDMMISKSSSNCDEPMKIKDATERLCLIRLGWSETVSDPRRCA